MLIFICLNTLCCAVRHYSRKLSFSDSALLCLNLQNGGTDSVIQLPTRLTELHHEILVFADLTIQILGCHDVLQAINKLVCHSGTASLEGWARWLWLYSDFVVAQAAALKSLRFALRSIFYVLFHMAWIDDICLICFHLWARRILVSVLKEVVNK